MSSEVAMSSVVIIGAGLGGLRTAEALRARGFTGAISVVGAEPWYPYNRPPLSKDALTGDLDVATLEFRRRSSIADVTWRLGTSVVGVNIHAREVALDDGSRLTVQGIAVATGLRPRRLPLDGPTEGRCVLRTLDDARSLRAQLHSGARVVIIGAGFIGGELASTARSLGCEVDVVAVEPVPWAAVLGAPMGEALQRRHEADGVRFHLGRTVRRVLGEQRASGVELDDGTTVQADVIVEAVGSIPNTECVAHVPGIDVSNGILTDNHMRVVGVEFPMVAVGDVARFPNPLFDEVPRRVEHWSIPTDTGRRAGATLAALLAGEPLDPTPFTPLPSFWSDQAGVTLQSFGAPALADDIRLVDGTLETACICEYWRDGRLVGVVGIDRTAELAPYRARLATSAS